MKCYDHPDIDAIGTCANCGKAICSNCMVEMGGKQVCKSCVEKMTSQPAGAVMTAPVTGRKEPILSLVLSFLIPGLGQIYNGQPKKGLILLVGCYGWMVISIILMFVLIGFCTILGVFVIFLYALYDAYVTADKINKGEPVKDWLS